MFGYIALIALPLFLTLVFRNLNDIKQKQYFLVITGLALFCFLAFRSIYIGSEDTFNYHNMMIRAINSESWAEYNSTSNVEKGFKFFVFLLSRVFKNPQVIIIVSAIFYVSSLCYFLYHNSDDVVLSMLMYMTLGLMTFQMQGMRQAIAMSICLFSLEFAKKNKFIPFLLIVLLAMQFHRTAIVFVVVYFLMKVKYSTENIFLISILGIIGINFSDKIIEVANDVFDKNYTKSVDKGGFIATAIYVLILLFALLYNSNLRLNGRSTQMFFVMLIAAFCYIMRYFGATAAERISFYFMYSQIILLPNTLKCLDEREAYLVRNIIIVLSIGLFFYRIRGTNFIPYEFYF